MSCASHIDVRLDLYDAAALPSVLRHRREEVERTLRLRAAVLSADAVADLHRFAGQLDRAIAAIEERLPRPSRDTLPTDPPAATPANLEA